MTPQFKTRAEQKLEWLGSLHRPLSEAESDELRRSLHATYCRNRNLALAARIEAEMNAGMIAEYDRENAALAKRARREI